MVDKKNQVEIGVPECSVHTGETDLKGISCACESAGYIVAEYVRKEKVIKKLQNERNDERDKNEILQMKLHELGNSM